jgi:hypothetical protein
MLSMTRMVVSSTVASIVFAGTASAAVVFDNYANVGPGGDSVNGAGSNNVRWYAVYAANASNAPTLDLTKLRVRIVKNAGFAGASLEAFVATANGSDLSTALPRLIASGGTQPAYTSLGTVSLTASATDTNSSASWGNGTSTQATVALNNSWSTNGCFFVGFRFTYTGTPSAVAAIRLSTGSSETGGLVTAPTTGAIDNRHWKSTGSVTGAVTGPLSFGNAAYSNVACMDVTGNLVPAPGALAMLGVAGLIGARRRR